jgi:hypothetical protein
MGLRAFGMAAGMALLAGLTTARADDLSLFHAAMEDVASHNRVAIGYLHNENFDLALVELERMKDSWGAFAEKFGGNRPAQLRDSPLYVNMLVDVPTRIVTALIMINFGRPQIAANSLEAIREEMSAVRRAGGVTVLADCVLDSHAAMEALSLYRDKVPDWSDPATLADVSAKADAYGAVVRRCDGMAGESVRNTPEFRRLIDGIAASLAFVPKAIETHDRDLIYRVIIELRAFDDLLAFRYG